MIGPLAGWLVKRGLDTEAARPLAWAITLFAGGLLAIAALALWLRLHDRAVVHAAQNAAEAKAAPIVRKADENASESRERANVGIQQRTQEMRNALDPLPNEKLSPRDRARYCAILRRQAAERGAETPSGC